jgi:hypothetical protein
VAVAVPHQVVLQAKIMVHRVVLVVAALVTDLTPALAVAAR